VARAQVAQNGVWVHTGQLLSPTELQMKSVSHQRQVTATNAEPPQLGQAGVPFTKTLIGPRPGRNAFPQREQYICDCTFTGGAPSPQAHGSRPRCVVASRGTREATARRLRPLLVLRDRGRPGGIQSERRYIRQVLDRVAPTASSAPFIRSLDARTHEASPRVMWGLAGI
jgi:hypothetical protein